MKQTFKHFFVEKLYYKNQEELDFNEKSLVIPDKWDTILFFGDYNPITRKEYNRIINFLQNFSIDSYRINVGLISNSEEDNFINKIQRDIQFELNFEERNFITTKFFGLKIFKMNITKILYLLKSYIDNKNIEKDIQLYMDDIIFEFKSNFYSNNVLIVMRPEDYINLQEFMKITEIVSDEINLGFMFWDNKKFSDITIKNQNYRIFGNFLPMTGKMIKAIVLLNFEKPNPEDLKNFCYKYKLQDLFTEIKNIHFKLNNDNYHLAFEYLFPDVILQNEEFIEVNNEVRKYNLLVIMEILKEMYLKNTNV
ncbi:MAG: hypothetical protein NZZ41_01750 [Candidatus Dojkabacteria bacterium]|nr:hypothetical protein [Candidatus Dojkabacteria bacterium]